MDIPPIETFGRRIMVCGPSNAGKSTLSVAIGQKLGIAAVHLDQLSHLPNTDWADRPREDFVRLHDQAIAGGQWVMDGNYSGLMAKRLNRATGIILLSSGRIANMARYFRRTLFEKDRPGNLEGALDSIKWEMIHWIWVVSPRNLRRYRLELPRYGLPYLEVRGMGQLNELYLAWRLTRG
jgi:adenylate kinase family enzyme